MSYFAQKADDHTITLEHAYLFASGIVLSTAITCLSFHPYMLFTTRTAVRVRVALSGMIYQKTLRLIKSSTEDGDNGKIINLLTNDLAKFDSAFIVMHEAWKGPLQSVMYLAIIYHEVGWSGVFGVVFLLSFIPLQGKFLAFKISKTSFNELVCFNFKAWIGKRSGDFQMKSIKRTDIRVRVMNEILLGIQVIKMYAWEESFAKMVNHIRK